MDDFRKKLQKTVADSSARQQDDAQLLHEWSSGRWQRIASELYKIAQNVVMGTQLTVHSVPGKGADGLRTITIEIRHCEFRKGINFFRGRDTYALYSQVIGKGGIVFETGLFKNISPHLLGCEWNADRITFNTRIVEICRFTDEQILSCFRDNMEQKVLLFAKNNPGKI